MQDAKLGLLLSSVHGTALRTFQDWTALTPCGPREGGLMLLPNINVVTAYMILRPFLKAPDDGDWKDPEKWTFDDSAWFPGTVPYDSQLLSSNSHPHLHLEETLVSFPTVQPGDTVCWHCDVSLIKRSKCLYADMFLDVPCGRRCPQRQNSSLGGPNSVCTINFS
jgi:hypothetical protein